MKKVQAIIECWVDELANGANAIKVCPTFESAKAELPKAIAEHCLYASNGVEEWEEEHDCKFDDCWENEDHTYWKLETDGYSTEFYIQEVGMAE